MTLEEQLFPSKISESQGSMEEVAKPKKLSVEDLDAHHCELFVRALCRVLATDLAKLTYAQIIDGLPLSDTVDDTVGGGLSNKHPLYDMHDELCDGVMERTEEMSDSFDPNVLKFDSQVCPSATIHVACHSCSLAFLCLSSRLPWI